MYHPEHDLILDCIEAQFREPHSLILRRRSLRISPLFFTSFIVSEPSHSPTSSFSQRFTRWLMSKTIKRTVNIALAINEAFVSPIARQIGLGVDCEKGQKRGLSGWFTTSNRIWDTFPEET